MLFRLTFLLVGAVFIAMYFAPDLPEESRAARELASRQAPPAAEPPRDTAQVDEAAPAEPDSLPETAGPSSDATGDEVPDVGSETTRTAPDPSAEDVADAADSATGEERRLAPLVIEGLSGGDAAAALSLSERIRARADAERAASNDESGAAQPAPDPSVTARLDSTPPPGPGEQRAQVIATSVNLRGGPSTANPVVGRVDFGDEIVVLGEASPGWSRIRHPDTGEDAFMASRFLETLGN